VGSLHFTNLGRYKETFLILIHSYREHENIARVRTDGVHNFFSPLSLGVNGRVVLKSIFHGVDWIHLTLNMVTWQALVHIIIDFQNFI
jgi:hypothetical protein